jgi:hypothetical protein
MQLARRPTKKHGPGFFPGNMRLATQIYQVPAPTVHSVRPSQQTLNFEVGEEKRRSEKHNKLRQALDDPWGALLLPFVKHLISEQKNQLFLPSKNQELREAIL